MFLPTLHFAHRVPARVAALALALFALDCREPASSKSSPTPPSHPVASAAIPAPDSATVLALVSPRGGSETDAAIARMQTLAARVPSKADLWTSLGQAWVRKARESSDPGYYLNAEACAELALRVSPDDTMALDLRAMVLLNEHRFEEARRLAVSTAARAPEDSTAYGTLSDALLELGLVDKAVAAAQTMVDLKPNAASYSRAAHLRWLRGDVRGAERIMREAIDSTARGRSSEPRAWILTDAAMLFWHHGDYDGADAGFDLALGSMSDYPPALVGKARVRLAKGDARVAVGLLERAYARSPLVETAWLLGDARALAGDDAGAAEAYLHVERDGRRSDPRTLSLFESTKGKNPDESLALAERERSSRDGAYTEDVYAWALYRNGRFAEARRASDVATQWGTPDARLAYHAGAIRIAQGDGVGGRALVRRALALNPRFDVAAVAEAHALLEGTHARR